MHSVLHNSVHKFCTSHGASQYPESCHDGNGNFTVTFELPESCHYHYGNFPATPPV